MHPTLFSIFGHEVSSYAFFMVLAFLVVTLGVLLTAKARGFAVRPVLVVLVSTALAALVGARLLNIITAFGFYAAHPAMIWTWDTVGFALFGGIILASIVGYLACRLLKLDVWKLGDTAAPFLGLGIALMRVGCYLNGCCFGRETDLPWGVTFPVLSPAHRYQLAKGTSDLLSVHPVHPTELYELAAALIASLIAVYVTKKKMPDGTAILSFILSFSVFRWLDYYLRVPASTFDASPYFYPLFYLVLILVSLFLIIKRLRSRCKSSR